jgi:TonB-dependent starch-binding outer membrane protein SusC
MLKLFVFLLCLIALAAQAQHRTIRGRVFDATDKNPLPGATLEAMGLTKPAQTDPNGRFTINVPKSAMHLTIRYVGYETQTILLKSGWDTLTILMKPDARTLDEVVVTGIGTPMRREVTGSITTISAAEESGAMRVATPTKAKATHRTAPLRR